MGKYQNSVCLNNYLHDYEQITTYPNGIYERCARCHDKQFFPWDVSNTKYISHHLRSAIQPTDERYAREYPNSKHIIHG